MGPKRSRYIGAVRRSPRLSTKLESGKSATSVPEHLAKGKSATSMPEHLAKGKSAKASSSKSRKSATSMPEHLAKRKSAKASSSKSHRGMASDPSDDDVDIEKIMRADREHEAIHFKKMYKLKDDCPEERKTCIHPRGEFGWSKSSFGITWVALRGTASTCVAFRKTLVKDRLTSYLSYNPAAISFNFLGTTIISEIEALARGSSKKLPETCKGQHVQEPFAIVCVVPGTVNDVNEEAALNYLRDTVEKGKDRTFYPIKAKVVAVRALQKLYDQTFKPEDIWIHEAFYGDEQCLSYQSVVHLLNVVKWQETGNDALFVEHPNSKGFYKESLA